MVLLMFASAGAVFMSWAKQLLQIEGLDLPRQIKELLEEFKDVFLDELPIHFNQQNKKNTKSIQIKINF